MDQNRRIFAAQLVAAATAGGGIGKVLAAEPQQETKMPAPPPDGTNQASNAKRLPRVLKAWMEPWTAGGLSAAGALDGYFASLTPDSTYTDPNFPKTVSALSLREHWREEFSAFPDARFETVSVDALSERAWVWRWMMHGTHTGPLMGFPGVVPTGRRFTMPGCDFIELRGDLVSSDVGYFDRFTFLSQLGFTLKQPPTPAT